MVGQGIPVYTPRQLFDAPETPEGWIPLAAQWIRDFGGDPQEVNPTTISGRLIIRQGPQWAQRLMVGQALAGTLDTPAAREVRSVFQTGTAISLAAWGGFERFTTFQEVFRRLGGGRYAAGLPPNEYNYLAANDYKAYQEALSWCAERRKDEIHETREKARRWRDQVAEASRIIVDVYELLLRNQGLLLTTDNDVVAWENGAHGLYVCEARTWCYGLECSPQIAVAYYLLALQDRQEQAAQVPKETALELLTVKMPDWRRTGRQSFAWKGGHIDEQGVVTQGRTSVGAVAIEEVGKGGRLVRRVVLRGRANKLLDEGVLSVSTGGAATGGDAEARQKEMDLQELALAWGVQRALARLKKKKG